MNWTRLYDPSRTPAHWTELVREGQFAVFLLDTETRVARDLEGLPFDPDQGPSLALFHDLVEARTFAQDTVTRHPDMCAEIYDHHGKANEPLEVLYDPSVRHKYAGPRYAKRQAVTGGMVLATGLAFAAYDISRNFAWMWGYAIGLKLVLVGGFRFGQGLLAIREERSRAQG